MIIDVYALGTNPSGPGLTDGQILVTIQSITPPDTTTVRYFTINDGSSFQSNGFGNFRAYTSLGKGDYVVYVRIGTDFSTPIYITLKDGSEPVDPDAMVYKDFYHGEICDKNGDTINVDIKRRLRAGDPDPDVKNIIFGGEEPIAINYKEDGDYKQHAIIGSEAILKIKAVNGFQLSSIYTESETEWQVNISGAWNWVGFVIPDSCSEPYVSEPYDVEIQATDRTGTLKTVDFQNDDLTKIDGTYSDQEMLRIALEKTGLQLPMVVAVNTREATMNTFGSNGCPLAKCFISGKAFINADGVSDKTYDVIESIIDRWSSRLLQWDGKWHIINVLELSKGTIPSTLFLSNGDYSNALTIGNAVNAGGIDRAIQPQGEHYTAKGIKSSTVRYDYGYISSGLYNGNFDIWTTKPSGLPDGWSAVGITATGETRQVDGVDTTDNYITITNSSGTGYVENTSSVQIRSGERSTINFDYLSIGARTAVLQDLYVRIIIHDTTNDRYFTPYGWQAAPGGGAFRTYNIRKVYNDFFSQLAANIDVDAQDGDFQITIAFMAIWNGSSTYFDISINNCNITQGVTNALVKPGIGLENKQTSRKNINYTRESIKIKHGEEPLDTQKTSGIVIETTTGAGPSSSWKRAGYTEDRSLYYIIANSELINHQRPYSVFNGVFWNAYKEDLGALTLLSIDRLVGKKFIFLSGTFLLKEGHHKLRYAEALTDDPFLYDEQQYEVYE